MEEGKSVNPEYSLNEKQNSDQSPEDFPIKTSSVSPEEPEDLESLSSLESLEDLSDAVAEYDGKLLTEHSVLITTANYQNSSVPTAVLDRDLVIRWKNSAFSNLIVLEEPAEGKSLTTLFIPMGEQEDFFHLRRSINSADTGFSFQSQLEYHSRNSLAMLLNATISPIFTTEDTPPLCFLMNLHDITEGYRNLLKNTYSGLLDASILKDNDTGKHIERVGAYAKRLAEELYNKPDYPMVDKQYIADISNLAPMHDVGKIGTPDDILNKEGPLEDWEWDIMKEHTINGAYLLSTYPNLMAKDIALFHHENWNGTGYPYQVSETMIPLAARITALGDVYDALRMERSYKKGISHDNTVLMIQQQNGTKFDPDLVKIFLNIHEDFDRIWNELKD